MMAIFLSNVDKLRHGSPIYHVPAFCYKCDTLLYGGIVRRTGSTICGSRWYHIKCAVDVGLVDDEDDN